MNHARSIHRRLCQMTQSLQSGSGAPTPPPPTPTKSLPSPQPTPPSSSPPSPPTRPPSFYSSIVPLLHISNHHSEPLTTKKGLLICTGLHNQTSFSILIDSGANPSFLNLDRVRKLFPDHPLKDPVQVQLADKRTITGYTTSPLSFTVQGTSFSDSHSFTAVPSLAYDMILGKDWLNRHNPQIDWPTNTVTIKSHSWICTPPKQMPEILTAKQFAASLHNLQPDDICGALVPKESSDQFQYTTSDSNKKDLLARAKLPPALQALVDKYPKVFSTFEGLPPTRPTDMKIDLEPGLTPPWRPIYPMNEKELTSLKEELEFLLKHGRIRESISPYGAPVFFVKSKDKLRLVFDYRALNKQTIKNRAPLPNILESLDRLSQARYFQNWT